MPVLMGSGRRPTKTTCERGSDTQVVTTSHTQCRQCKMSVQCEPASLSYKKVSRCIRLVCGTVASTTAMTHASAEISLSHLPCYNNCINTRAPLVAQTTEKQAASRHYSPTPAYQAFRLLGCVPHTASDAGLGRSGQHAHAHVHWLCRLSHTHDPDLLHTPNMGIHVAKHLAEHASTCAVCH